MEELRVAIVPARGAVDEFLPKRCGPHGASRLLRPITNGRLQRVPYPETAAALVGQVF